MERGHDRIACLRFSTFISYLITLYIYVIIASVILSWLMAFGVVNPYNPFVRAIWQGLNAVTEPLLRPIRNMLPDLGAIDISPIVLLLACFFVQGLIAQVLLPALVVTRRVTGAEQPWRAGNGCVIVRVRLTPKSSIEGVDGVAPTRGRAGACRPACARCRPRAKPTRRWKSSSRAGSTCRRARCA